MLEADTSLARIAASRFTGLLGLGRIARPRWSCGVAAALGALWDAYLAFGKNSRWRNEPSDVLASGSDIIDNTSGLEQHFIPLLARG